MTVTRPDLLIVRNFVITECLTVGPLETINRMPKIPILVSYPQQISDIIIFSQENQNKRVTYTLSNYKFFQMTFKKMHLHILILFADMKKTSTLLKT